MAGVPQFRSSKPSEWVRPRACVDPSLRRHAYGPIEPMDDPRRGSIRLALLIVALFVVGLLACEALRSMLQGAPV